jgi:hypothetical protein
MNQKIEKIKLIEGFFSGQKVDTRSVEPFFVIRTTRNGKLIEPAGMTEKDFDIYLERLKTKHRNILVFNSEMQD